MPMAMAAPESTTACSALNTPASSSYRNDRDTLLMRSVWLNALPSRVRVRVMVDVDVTVPLVTCAL
jgi:hypothetical protein